MTEFPRRLAAISGPYPAAKIAGAAMGMGSHGVATQELISAGRLPPDLICGMTLALLARQPRKPASQGGSSDTKASGVAGGVWVRERFTIHQPVATADPWLVEGEGTGTYVRKGRSYSTTASRSQTQSGERFATNLTTGLFGYKPDPSLSDSVQGLPLEQTPAPEPDWEAARANPNLGNLKGLQVGQQFGGERLLVSLAMMAARDTDNPDNPIHSDPEEARKAGLAKPIAGGSHVLAFGLEPIMAALGTDVLLYGSHLDVRWKAPTEADVYIVPKATATTVDQQRIVFDLRVDLEGGPTAMIGQATIPLAS